MTASRKVRRSPTGPLRKQANAIPRATHPAMPHLATKDFAKRVVTIIYKRDSGEGKAESDLGIFRLAYEHTGSRREEDEEGAHNRR